MTGLEALNVLARNVESLEIDTFYECKGAYQKLEKSLKALEIIKGKLVDVSLIKKYDFVEDYNSAVWFSGRPKLVKEEFETIKEVLGE